MMRRIGFLIVLLMMGLATLSACGRKGPPQPPPDAADEFPRKYPSE